MSAIDLRGGICGAEECGEPLFFGNCEQHGDRLNVSLTR